jgi:hypothetical protein
MNVTWKFYQVFTVRSTTITTFQQFLPFEADYSLAGLGIARSTEELGA